MKYALSKDHVTNGKSGYKLTIIMVATSPYQCLTLSLLIIPPLLLGTYLLAAFPLPPAAVYVHPSLVSLPPTSKSWTIYPEDFYSGGSYATFPNGKVSSINVNTRSNVDVIFFKVRYWLLGPEKGKKV